MLINLMDPPYFSKPLQVAFLRLNDHNQYSESHGFAAGIFIEIRYAFSV
jgi:hypothetical protein